MRIYVKEGKRVLTFVEIEEVNTRTGARVGLLLVNIGRTQGPGLEVQCEELGNELGKKWWGAEEFPEFHKAFCRSIYSPYSAVCLSDDTIIIQLLKQEECPVMESFGKCTLCKFFCGAHPMEGLQFKSGQPAVSWCHYQEGSEG
jgi:hypothetical protein